MRRGDEVRGSLLSGHEGRLRYIVIEGTNLDTIHHPTKPYAANVEISTHRRTSLSAPNSPCSSSTQSKPTATSVPPPIVPAPKCSSSRKPHYTAQPSSIPLLSPR